MSKPNQERGLKQILSGAGYAGKEDQFESMKHYINTQRAQAVQEFVERVKEKWPTVTSMSEMMTVLDQESSNFIN